MKNQLQPAQAPQQANAGLKEIFAKITKTELAENVFLLLLSRICFMEYLVSPFGISMFCVLFAKSARPSYVISCVLGILLTANPLFYFKYIGTMLIVLTFTVIFRRELKNKKDVLALIATGALFVNGGVYVIAEGLFLYDFMMLVVESGLCYLSFFVFWEAEDNLRSVSYRCVYEPRDLVCLTLLCACAILSVSLIESLLPLAHILAITIILFLALTCGFSVSTPAGAVLSLSVGLATAYPAQIVCAYTLSALFAGLVSRYGRLAVSGIFAAGSFVVTWLIFPESNGLLTVSYVAVSCLVLFFVPDKALLSFGTSATDTTKNQRGTYRTQELVAEELSGAIETVNSVSDIFHDIIKSYCDSYANSYDAVFDATANAVCANCSLCRFCWHKEKIKTVSLLENMITVMESKGIIGKKDIPADFLGMCIRCDGFISELNKNFESHKVTKMWSGKVAESKKLVAEQFKNISMILENLQENLDKKLLYSPELERKIKNALDKIGVSAANMRLISDEGIAVELHQPVYRVSECIDRIGEVLSEIFEVEMVAEKKENGVLLFYQKPEFCISSAVLSKACRSSQVCGDNCSEFYFAPGRYAIVLSDGMGSGERANFQSSVAVRLAKKLLCGGMKSETCVRLINNILMTNADRETFATVDLCVINLYSGIVEFVKTGAAPSYIKKEKENITVTSTSLPAGLIPVVDSDFCVKYSQNGDVLVMVSDGVSDVLDNGKRNEFFSLIDADAPEAEVCERILNRAYARSGGIATDDMTVCVCKISKNQ